MEKKNKLGNKGFMLLETLIVSTIILSTLVFLYIQFANIKTNYDISFRYNTIPGLYAAKEIGDFLTDNNSTLSDQVDTQVNGYINITSASTVSGNSDLYSRLITDFNVNTIIYTTDDLTKLKEYLNNGTDVVSTFSEEFKKYIMNLNTKSTFKDRIIIKFNDNTFASIIIGGNN